MRVEKKLKNYAKQDLQKITEGEQSRSILQKLLEKNENMQNDARKPKTKMVATCLCPDCGNELVFKSKYGIFMHENSDQLHCYYAADEFGKCVNNNELRAERIRNYAGKTFNDAKFD